MIVEARIERGPNERTTRMRLKASGLHYPVRHEVERAFASYPGARRVIAVRRGPQGSVRPAPDEVMVVYGGCRGLYARVEVGSAVGPTAGDIRRSDEKKAIVLLRERGLLGEIASHMAQDARRDADAALSVAHDLLHDEGFSYFDHHDVVAMVNDSLSDFETELP